MRAGARAPSARRASGCSTRVAIALASASGSSGGTRMPPPPVRHHLGQRAARRRDHGRAAGHRLRRRQAEALVARGHHHQRRAPVERDELLVATRPVIVQAVGAAELARPAAAPRCAGESSSTSVSRSPGARRRERRAPGVRTPLFGSEARPDAEDLALARGARAGSGRNSSVSRPFAEHARAARARTRKSRSIWRALASRGGDHRGRARRATKACMPTG